MMSQSHEVELSRFTVSSMRATLRIKWRVAHILEYLSFEIAHLLFKVEMIEWVGKAEDLHVIQVQEWEATT